MLTQQIALVSEIAGFDFSALTSVSAALQKQVSRDVAPIWGVQSTVDAFQSLDDVPLGYWPLVVTNQPLGKAAGVHMDQDGQPYALVEVSDSWSLTASHECLEMLVDPFGNRTIAGPSPKADQGRVEFLVEVCDPCEDAAFAYTVNDVLVSDFYTPHFFDPTAGDNVAYRSRKPTRRSRCKQMRRPRRGRTLRPETRRDPGRLWATVPQSFGSRRDPRASRGIRGWR